jgi:hypothetical protein
MTKDRKTPQKKGEKLPKLNVQIPAYSFNSTPIKIAVLVDGGRIPQKQETDTIFSIVLYEERQKCFGKVFPGEKGFFFLQIGYKYISILGKELLDGFGDGRRVYFRD